jgi:pimeloyl-ACP methyl ester carboxylesterase/DNA-binding CsgD family transcriptional regulator
MLGLFAAAACAAQVHPRQTDETTAMIPRDPTIRFCTAVDGIRLAYASVGAGPVLIKAATWLGHLEHDWHSPVWSHLLQAMSRHHTLVLHDERGCGLSDWDVADLSFDRWVDDLHSVAEAAGARRFALLGISQGAPIAIDYAVRHPERVSHLVLHGGYARGRLVRARTPQDVEEAELMTRIVELGWGKSDPAYRQLFTSQFIPGGSTEQQYWFNELERLSTSPQTAARFLREFNGIDVTHLLPQVSCPTLVLHSRHDARVPFDEGRLLASGIPGAHFVPIESRNHLLMAGEPGWMQWLDAVNAFLPIQVSGHPRIESLTPRQREMLELIAQGRDNSQIAATLGLSEKTVRNHVSAVFTGLGVESRAQAIVLARDAGLGRVER